MSEEDKRYLKQQKKLTPNLEVFSRLVKILNDLQKKTDQLLKTPMLKKD